jgi:hypothetical protein
VDGLQADPSDGFLHQAGAEATGANPEMFMRAVHQGTDSLQVRIEDTLGLVVGVADVMAALMPLPADITCKSHDPLSFPSS